MPFSTGDTQLDSDLALKAQVFRFNHHGYNHQKFRDTQHHMNREAKKKLADGAGVFCRLMMVCGDLTHYIVHAADLGLNRHCEHWTGYFDPSVIATWKTTINAVFKRHWARLEVGDNGRLHAHVLSDSDAPLQLSEQSVRAVYDLAGIARYLSKSALPVDDVVMGYYLERKGSIPRSVWSRNVPQSGTLAKTPIVLSVNYLNDLNSEQDVEPSTESVVNNYGFYLNNLQRVKYLRTGSKSLKTVSEPSYFDGFTSTHGLIHNLSPPFVDSGLYFDSS